MEYGYVIDRAWKIIWRHKILFVFGLLVSLNIVIGLVSSGFNSFRAVPMDPEAFESMKVFWVWGPTYGEFLQYSEDPRFLTEFMGIFFGLMALGLLFQLVMYIISLFGKLGLIHGTIEAEVGTEEMSFGDLFQKTVPFFWRMLGMNLLVWVLAVGISIVGFFAMTFLGAIGSGGSESSGGFFMLFFCCFMCFFFIGYIAITMMMTQANVALVAEDLGIFQALGRGWQVFRKNLGVFFFLLIIFIVLGILVYILMMLPNIPIFINMFRNIETMTSPEDIYNGMGRSIPWMILGGIFNLVVQVFFRTYFQPFWTLTFFQLTGKEEETGGDEPLADNDLIAEEAVT